MTRNITFPWFMRIIFPWRYCTGWQEENSALVNVKRVSYNCFVCLYEPVISDCIAGKDLMSERGEENEKKRLV